MKKNKKIRKYSHRIIASQRRNCGKTVPQLDPITDVLRSIKVEPTEGDLHTFKNWLILDGWKRYREECMEKYNITQKELNTKSMRFPNGSKGKAYEKTVPFDVEKYEDFKFEGLDDTGLKAEVDCEHNAIVLKGTPEVASEKDLKFKLHFKLKHSQKDDPSLEQLLFITINPDPKDLWKNIPVPKDIKFYKEDEDSFFYKAEDRGGQPQKNILAVSKRGRSHANEGKPRDDDFRASCNPENGWYVIAVADGAGSAKYSREGSRLACETAEKYCKDILKEKGEVFEAAICAFKGNSSDHNKKSLTDHIHNVVTKAAFEGHKAIIEVAKKCSEAVEPKDFATTLLLVICRRFEFGWFLASFSVGDGAIAIYDEKSDSVKLLMEPDEGEYAGQTRFLTMESIFKDGKVRINMSIVEDFTALMLMTDGVSDPFFETDANLNKKEKWDALWANISEKVNLQSGGEELKTKLLEWLDFWSGGNHDDRTIALLY